MAEEKKGYQENVKTRKADKSGSEILNEGLRAMAITYGAGLGTFLVGGSIATVKEARRLHKLRKDRKKLDVSKVRKPHN